MNPVITIQRFVLKMLKASAVPVNETVIDDAIYQQMGPKTLQAHINEARRELQREGLINGEPDEWDKSVMTWTITTAGQHKARSL